MTEPRHIASPWAIRIPIILLAIGFFSIPFSPSLNSLIMVTGLWCVIYPPLRKQLGFYIKQPAFFWGCAFYIWIVIRMIHDDPIVSNHLKLHYFLHYFNLFLPIFLLPPLFRQAKDRLMIYSCVILAGFLISIIVWAATLHLATPNSFIYQKFTTIETEPMAVLYVFCAYLTALLAYQYRTKAITLITCTLLFIWFTFIIVAVQTERVAVVLYLLAVIYFLFTHFNKKISLTITAAFIVAAGLFLTLSHSTMHNKAASVYQNAQTYLQSDTSMRPSNSTGLRLYFYNASYHLFEKQPLLGYGSGTFSGVAPKYQKPYTNKPFEMHHDATPENNYVNIILQLGLIGFFIFLFYFIYLRSMLLLLDNIEKNVALGIFYLSLFAAISFPALTYNIVSISLAGLLGVSLGAIKKHKLS